MHNLKKDLGEIAILTKLPILIKGTGLILQYNPTSSWSLMAMFLPAAKRNYLAMNNITNVKSFLFSPVL